MKKNLLYTFMAIGCLSLASCGEDDLTPSIDISPEYEANLALTKSSIHADTVIYKWYQKYNTAILYKFNDNDPTWLWSSKLTNGFKKFDISNREDSIAVEEMVDNLKTQLFDGFSDDFLAERLPYRIFLTKQLYKKADESSGCIVATNNNQDNMIIGYADEDGYAYRVSKFKDGTNTVFAKIFFESLNPQPTDFINLKVACAFNLPSMPLKPGGTGWKDTDPELEKEQKVYPDFVDPNDATAKNLHILQVLGYMVNGATMGAKLPTDAQDYAGYLDFIGNKPGSYIRQRTQYYWRIARRAKVLIEYQKTYQNEDLIAKQNAKYPDDKVTIEDFAYPEDK